MASAAHDKTTKPKKVVMSYGRGGGNVRKVTEKKYATETSRTPSTARKMLEVEPPRMKMAVSTGRGGSANYFPHVLEEGVFDRVMEYEKTRIQEYKSQQAAKRPRTYSNVKSSKASSLGSDDAASQARISLRRSWASKSTIDVATHSISHSPPTSSPITRDTRKSLRDTLLAPLRTTFTRNPRPSSTQTAIRDDTSSFSACSLSEPHFAMDDSISPLASPIELYSPSSPTLSDEAYSGIMTPSTAELFEDLGAAAVAARHQQTNGMLARRKSTGTHRSPRSSKRFTTLSAQGVSPPPLPSPTMPLPPLPLPMINVNGRTSLPPLPRHPTFAPPHPDEVTPPPLPPLSSSHPTQSTIKTRIAAGAISIKSLQANPIPILRSPAPPLRSLSASSLASGSSSKDADARYGRLAATYSPPRIITTPEGVEEDDMEIKLNRLRLTTDLPTPETHYYSSTAASSRLELPIARPHRPTAMHASREASCYDDSDVDRVDPFLTLRVPAAGEEVQYLTVRGVDSVRVGKRRENVENMPWRNASVLSSSSSISIPSFNESQPGLLAE